MSYQNHIFVSLKTYFSGILSFYIFTKRRKQNYVEFSTPYYMYISATNVCQNHFQSLGNLKVNSSLPFWITLCFERTKQVGTCLPLAREKSNSVLVRIAVCNTYHIAFAFSSSSEKWLLRLWNNLLGRTHFCIYPFLFQR